MASDNDAVPIDVPVVVSSTPAAILAYLRLAIASNLAGGGLQEWKVDSRKSVLWDLGQLVSAEKYYAGLVANESLGGAVTYAGLSQRP